MTMQTVQSRPYDVIITGQGLAGLVLSMLLERAGINHLVLARREHKQYPALAETLPSSALPLLDRLGIRPLVEAFAERTFGYHAIWGTDALQSNHFWGQRPYPYGLKLRKQALP